jgi:hypothetical protein
MGQVLHGSATTTEAVRRAIQHSHVWTALADHVWTALADQGLSAMARSSRVRSCLRPFGAGRGPAGPDGFRWFVCLIKRTSLALRLCCRLHEPKCLRLSHHDVVTPDIDA